VCVCIVLCDSTMRSVLSRGLTLLDTLILSVHCAAVTDKSFSLIGNCISHSLTVSTCLSTCSAYLLVNRSRCQSQVVVCVCARVLHGFHGSYQSLPTVL